MASASTESGKAKSVILAETPLGKRSSVEIHVHPASGPGSGTRARAAEAEQRRRRSQVRKSARGRTDREPRRRRRRRRATRPSGAGTRAPPPACLGPAGLRGPPRAAGPGSGRCAAGSSRARHHAAHVVQRYVQDRAPAEAPVAKVAPARPDRDGGEGSRHGAVILTTEFFRQGGLSEPRYVDFPLQERPQMSDHTYWAWDDVKNVLPSGPSAAKDIEFMASVMIHNQVTQKTILAM
ncbi:hypothetical protein PG997_000938 [Apiospora hydei]|uniref:Uncharacterized protein n=1 Tax=Apiospora hydei TaxID=1337664 RepID=A0ABR1XC53_9PEZI